MSAEKDEYYGNPQRIMIAAALEEWRDAGGSVADIVWAIEGLIIDRLQAVMAPKQQEQDDD